MKNFIVTVQEILQTKNIPLETFLVWLNISQKTWDDAFKNQKELPVNLQALLYFVLDPQLHAFKTDAILNKLAILNIRDKQKWEQFKEQWQKGTIQSASPDNSESQATTFDQQAWLALLDKIKHTLNYNRTNFMALLGLSAQSYLNWEKPGRAPSPINKAKIAFIAGEEAAFLLTDANTTELLAKILNGQEEEFAKAKLLLTPCKNAYAQKKQNNLKQEQVGTITGITDKMPTPQQIDQTTPSMPIPEEPPVVAPQETAIITADKALTTPQADYPSLETDTSTKERPQSEQPSTTALLPIPEELSMVAPQETAIITADKPLTTPPTDDLDLETDTSIKASTTIQTQKDPSLVDGAAIWKRLAEIQIMMDEPDREIFPAMLGFSRRTLERYKNTDRRPSARIMANLFYVFGEKETVFALWTTEEQKEFALLSAEENIKLVKKLKDTKKLWEQSSAAESPAESPQKTKGRKHKKAQPIMTALEIISDPMPQAQPSEKPASVQKQIVAPAEAMGTIVEIEPAQIADWTETPPVPEKAEASGQITPEPPTPPAPMPTTAWQPLLLVNPAFASILQAMPEKPDQTQTDILLLLQEIKQALLMLSQQPKTPPAEKLSPALEAALSLDVIALHEDHISDLRLTQIKQGIQLITKLIGYLCGQSDKQRYKEIVNELAPAIEQLYKNCFLLTRTFDTKQGMPFIHADNENL